MKIQLEKFFVVLVFIAFGVIGTIAQTSNGYHLIKKIEVGGEGGWDYLLADANLHRLYVSHSNKVVVINTETDAVIGEIPNTNGVHGIAVAPEFGRGFISAGRDNAVVVFDLQTLKPLETVKVGKNPDAILYDPATKQVFTFNGGSADATILDARTNKVTKTIALGGKPEFAQADGKGIVFVNIEDKNEIIQLDARKQSVKAHWSISPGEEASGLALDRQNHRLFAVCSNKKMIVMNSESGKIMGDLPIGTGADGAAFDPELKLAFSSNGEGSLTIVREDSKDQFSVAETVATQRGARTVSLDTKTHKIYLPTALFGETPAPTAERPRPRAALIPNSFVILVYGK